MDKVQQKETAETRTATAQLLSDEEAQAAWDAGYRMSLDEAVVYGLACIGER